MTSRRQHVVILPHFREEEVSRYEKIAGRIAQWKRSIVPIEFLVAASPKREPSQRLIDAFSRIGNVVAFKCPTQIFGYPEGPTAMFWDCMEFIAQRYPGGEGFALWLAGMIVWPLFLTPLQLFIIRFSFPSPMTGELWGFALLNLTQVGVSMCLLFSMRYAGIRLGRIN